MTRPIYGAVLCAGKGTRMHPLTEALPKPLIPFLNTPMVAYALNHLSRADITRVGLNLHHLADSIPPVVDRLAPMLGCEPVYVREWELLGSGGGLRGILHALSRDDDANALTLVALNGDSIMNIDLKTHLSQHQDTQALVTLVVRPKDDDQPGRVWLDEQGRLVRLRDHKHPSFIEGKTYQEFDFTGAQIVEGQALSRIEIERCDIITALYGPMLEAGEAIMASVMEGFWAAIDTPALLLKTQRRCLDDPTLFEQAPLPDPMRAGLFIYSPSQIDGTAKMAAPLLLGAHVHVSEQAILGPSVVADGVELLPGARLSECMIYGMGRLEGQWEQVVAIAGKIAGVAASDLA